MYQKGDLTKYEYVKYAPNNLVPQDMKSDFEEQEEEIKNSQNNPQISQDNPQDIMSQLTPEEQQYLMENPQLMEGL